MNTIGVGIGFLIPGAMVTENSTRQDSREQIKNLMLVEAIIATVMILPTFIFFRDKPPTPPRLVVHIFIDIFNI